VSALLSGTSTKAFAGFIDVQLPSSTYVIRSEMESHGNGLHWTLDPVAGNPNDQEQLTLVTLSRQPSPSINALGAVNGCLPDRGVIGLPPIGGVCSSLGTSRSACRAAAEPDCAASNCLATIAETKYGTAHGVDEAHAQMRITATEITQGYGTSPDAAPVVHVVSAVWYSDSAATASSCDSSGGCVADSDPSVAYTYNGCNGDGTCYRDHAWGDIDFWRTKVTIPGLMLVQVNHEGTITVPGLAGSYCGVSLIGTGTNSVGQSTADGRPHTDCRDYVSTHEAGHSIGGSDLDGGGPCGACGPGDDKTVMRYQDGRQNVFGDLSKGEIANCYAGSCPRAAPY
jgi:hypothetical protein